VTRFSPYLALKSAVNFLEAGVSRLWKKFQAA